MASETGFAALYRRERLRSAALAPFRRQTYRNLAYLALSIPLGIAYFAFLGLGLLVWDVLLFTVVGIPFLLLVVGFVLATTTGLASLERKLTAFLLGIDIAPPGESPLAVRSDRGVRERLKALFASTRTWKAVTYLATKIAFGVASFLVVTGLLVNAVSLLVVPFVYDQPHVTVGVVFEDPAMHPGLSLAWDGAFVGFRGTVPLTSIEVSTLPGAIGVALLGVVLAVVALNLLNLLAWISGRYAQVMLGEERLVTVREPIE